MKRQSTLLTLICAILLSVGLAACAPSQAMIATLTLLPGTPTNRPPTAWPTRTPRATNTLAPVRNRLATDTPIPPAACPTGSYDSAAPEDPSQLPGRHYDKRHLPEAFTLQDSGELSEPGFGWVQVKWQGRSLFWTEKLICKDAEKREYWEIVDVLALPRLDAKLGEAMTTNCFYGEKPAPFAVAYGIYDSTQPASAQPGGLRGWPLRVQAAYEVQENFIPLSQNGLSCVVPETPAAKK